MGWDAIVDRGGTGRGPGDPLAVADEAAKARIPATHSRARPGLLRSIVWSTLVYTRRGYRKDSLTHAMT